MLSPKERALRARETILKAHKNIHRGLVHKYFNENYQNLFKNDKEKVASAFVEIFREDKKLREAAQWLDHWVNIKELIEIDLQFRKKERKNSLFTYPHA